MLTATRARPPATSGPRPRRIACADPGGHGLVAALAAQRLGALVLEPGPTTRDDRRRRLARALRGQLATGGADLLPAVPPDRRRDAGRSERRREPLDHRVRRRRPR